MSIDNKLKELIKSGTFVGIILIIGKSVEQMRNVTSYIVISKALKSKIKDVLAVNKAYILNNFISTQKPRDLPRGGILAWIRKE